MKHLGLFVVCLVSFFAAGMSQGKNKFEKELALNKYVRLVFFWHSRFFCSLRSDVFFSQALDERL